MSDSVYLDVIRRHCRPLSPVPTDQAARLTELADVRAVLFDVYGTMLISASGDIGVAAAAARADAMLESLAAVAPQIESTYRGSQAKIPGAKAAEPECGPLLLDKFLGAIEAEHARRRGAGIEYPEVDIVEIWRTTLRESQVGVDAAALDLRRLAIEYEVRVNPVWPMPDLLNCLEALRASGLVLGIISNAQFYTALLFPALVDKDLEQLGFASSMQFYSYRLGQGKPGEELYRQAAESLATQGISPHQVLYIGNDMLNDITPAARQGFRTALFAGDQRSLRLREGDERVRGAIPDLVVTDLTSLISCIELCGGGD